MFTEAILALSNQYIKEIQIFVEELNNKWMLCVVKFFYCHFPNIKSWFQITTFFFFKELLTYLFIYFIIIIIIIIIIIFAVFGLRFYARSFSSCGKRGPLFIAVRWPFTVTASLVAGHRLQMRRLSSCGSRAQLLRGMWDPPRPGLEPVSPALAGRFSTTAPPGKPKITTFEMPHTLSLPAALALLRNPQDSCHLKHNLNLRRTSDSVL